MMFGGLTLMDRVELDYVKARRRARLGRLLALFGREESGLRDFEQARKSLGSYGTRRAGRCEIEVEKIVGSVGRSGDFDGSFMPRNGRLRQKWMRVARVFRTEGEFQPIRIYGLEGEYYVEDGNHRVSVAKFQGIETLDAEVTEIVTQSFVRLRCTPVKKTDSRLV